jgi:hypothetical protein
MRIFHAAPEAEAWRVVQHHPVLLLPELIDAADRALGPSRATAGLREMLRSLRGTPHFVAYHRLLATALARTPAGSRRVNLERALAVMTDVRGATAGSDDGSADADLERTLRAELEALSTPQPAPPPSSAASASRFDSLFLTEAELPGARCSEDHRGANPNPHDRTYVANGGLGAGSVVWLGNEAAPVYRVVDARWLFASTTAAKAYLESPATALLAGDGLPGLPAPPTGDGAYAWGNVFVRGQPETSWSRQCLMFRVDRVVARLHVTEGPGARQVFQRLSLSHVLPYAEAAVRRARWVLAQYWLSIARGREAADRFAAAPARTAHRLFADYPILLLPELATAMASLGESHRAAAERLVATQASFKTSWQPYRDAIRALVRALLDEEAGEPRTNADAALRIVIAHRRLDTDYAWFSVETECRARTV